MRRAKQKATNQLLLHTAVRTRGEQPA